MFEANHARFATEGTVRSLPKEVIDSIWVIIDADLQGVYPLENLLYFGLENNHGKLTISYSQDGQAIDVRVDLPFPYNENFPKNILVYDDGTRQTILLPNEAE
ncbi:DUF960 domain-containing protein [Enterococcus hirae]|jgi:hypothetical protein|nr:DUF960 domain-containing protein [Enterococcaceae bacterium]MCI1919424.1 DUF960 domain-containing protein [Enterococcaceae bacterium]MDM8213601.1 DUF960 domain-containing protein [Enterococcus hirae]